MPFVVIQIAASAKVLKPCFGINIGDTGTLQDVYNDFASGALDSTECVHSDFNSAIITASVGRSKSDLTTVDFSTKLGDAVGTLGNFIQFTVRKVTEGIAPERTVSAFDVLMKASRDRHYLPSKWKNSNKKLELKNDIIDWLKTNGIGWSSSEKDHLGVQFVNTLGSVFWEIVGNHGTLQQRGCGVPPELSSFLGYNKPENYKRPRVDTSKLTAMNMEPVKYTHWPTYYVCMVRQMNDYS